MTDSTSDYNLGDEALLNVTLDFDWNKIAKQPRKDIFEIKWKKVN